MLAKHTSREITEWREEHKRTPLGWHPFVKVCCVVASAMGMKKADGSHFIEEDFYPFAVKRTAMPPDVINSKLLALQNTARATQKKTKPPKKK